jgi:Enterobacter phage Enc34, ssDNA-binding protein
MTLLRDGKGKLKLQITEADNKSGSTAIIGPVRLSHMHVFKARANKLRKCDEYSVVLLIEKTDTELLKFVRERLQHGLLKVFGKPIAKYDSCLKDGDTEIDNDGEPKYPGHMFISTRIDLDQPPVILSPKSIPLDLNDAPNWVSGDWGYVKLDIFGYENEKNGVSTRLKAVQFSAKGIPFGKAPPDAEQVAGEFGEVEGADEPAATGSFLD